MVRGCRKVGVGSWKRLGHAFLVAAIVTGCAELERLLTPAPPEPPAVKREPSPLPPAVPPPPPPVAPPPSPPVLSPQIGRGDEDRMRREAGSRIQKTEQLVAQIDQKRLVPEQRETYSTIRSFLIHAKEALAVNDFPRAANLADKAQILAEELLRSVR